MESVSLEDLDDVDLLLTELEISRGRGNLILCSVASPAYRDRVIAAVAAHFSTRVMAVETGDKLISDLRNAKAEKEEILIWTLPERLSDDILDALNNFRELFYDSGVPNLVFITPAGVDEVIWKAPDFWRYRGGYHILKGEAKGAGLQALDALSNPLSPSYRSEEELLNRKKIYEYLLEKMQNKNEKGKILVNLGTIHFFLSETRESIKCHEQALSIFREIGNKHGEGAALGNLGDDYHSLGKIRKAIECYKQSLAINREIGDKSNEGGNLTNLGNTYYFLGETRKAIRYHEMALKVFHEIVDRHGEGVALGNLGNAYEDLGDTGMAIKYHEQALAIAQEIKDRLNEGIWLCNLGKDFQKKGEMSKAIDCFEQYMAIANEIGDWRGKGNASWSLSLAFDDLGNRIKAIKYAEVALKIYEDIEDPRAENVKRMLQGWKRR
jgi:tetratricopeptide (TPR) repeat protein